MNLSYLFFDKFIGDKDGNGDHGFTNAITSKLIINDFKDGSFNCLTGSEAVKFSNNKFEKNFRLPEYILEDKMYKPYVYTKNIDGLEVYCTVIGINCILLEKYIRSKIEIKNYFFLKSLCRFHMNYCNMNKLTNGFFYDSDSYQQKLEQNIKYIIDKAMTAVDYTIDNRIDKLKEVTINLFEYQKSSIYWMSELEKSNNTITYNLNDEIDLGNIYYDSHTQTFILKENRKSLNFKGGALIDEVGLGKTLQIISLAIVNPANSISVSSDKIKNKFISRATLVFCPNQLCGQWIRELKSKINSDYELKIIQLITKRDFDKLTYKDLLDADFVIVSFTFLDNKVFTAPWSSKISYIKSFNKKYWDPSAKELVKATFATLGNVLLSNPIESLFKTEPLIQLIHWHRIVIDEFHEIQKPIYIYIKNLLSFISADYKWCVSATPLADTPCLYDIVDFLSDYTNTDANRIYQMEPIVEYLSTKCFRRNTKNSIKQEHTLPPINEEIRWLKFSLPECTIYNAYLANSNHKKFDVFLRQLCCHPQLAEETKQALSNCKTLADIEKMMLVHYKLEVDDEQAKYDKIAKRIRKINRKINKIIAKQNGIKNNDADSDDSDDSNDDDSNDESDDDNGYAVAKQTVTLDLLKERIKNAEVKLAATKKVLDGKKATLNFYSNVINRLKKTMKHGVESNENVDINTNSNTINNNDINIMNTLSNQLADVNNNNDDDDDDEDEEDLCGICLSEMTSRPVSVTKCGHIFCNECLTSIISRYNQCPYCKHPLKAADIFSLTYERQKIEPNEKLQDNPKQILINEIGTK